MQIIAEESTRIRVPKHVQIPERRIPLNVFTPIIQRVATTITIMHHKVHVKITPEEVIQHITRIPRIVVINVRLRQGPTTEQHLVRVRHRVVAPQEVVALQELVHLDGDKF